MPLMYVWGHSYEFDRDDTWGVIEEFCKYMQGCDDVWYCTNLEICDYVNALRRLEYSVDGKKVWNPSAQTIWMKDEDTLLQCEPGKLTEIR